MRKQPELFIADQAIVTKPQRQLLGLMQDIEAAWQQLALFERDKQKLYNQFEQQALRYEHKLIQANAKLVRALLLYANHNSLTVQWRVMLMDWTDEVLLALESSCFVTADSDLASLREQFYQCYEDQWISWQDIDDDDMLDFTDAECDLFSDTAAQPLLGCHCPEDPSQLQRDMAQKLTELLPELLTELTTDGAAALEQVKTMLLACSSSVYLGQIPEQELPSLMTLLAEYRQRLDWLMSPMALTYTAPGAVWAKFSAIAAPELAMALAIHVKQLEQQLAEVQTLLQYSQSFAQLKPFLVKRHQQRGDYGWGLIAQPLPDNLH